MIREAAVALAFVVLIAVPTGAATPQVAPLWTATPLATNVTYGQPIQIIVGGPVNGTFNITLEGQPFNRSPAIVAQTYRIPQSNKSSPAGTLLVSIPTRPLYYGGFIVLVRNVTFNLVFSSPVFYIVNPINDTALQNNLYLIWEELNVTAARELSLLYQQSLQEDQIEELFWAMIVLTCIFMATVIITRTGAANRRWGKRIRAAFHNAFYGPAMEESVEGQSVNREVPAPDETRVMVSRLYPTCVQCATPQSTEEIVLHLRQDHRVREPKEGRDFEVKPSAVKTVILRRPGHEPSERLLRDAIDELDVDFSDLPGGAN
jgi:hypothetical protein